MFSCSNCATTHGGTRIGNESIGSYEMQQLESNYGYVILLQFLLFSGINQKKTQLHLHPQGNLLLPKLLPKNLRNLHVVGLPALLNQNLRKSAQDVLLSRHL